MKIILSVSENCHLIININSQTLIKAVFCFCFFFMILLPLVLFCGTSQELFLSRIFKMLKNPSKILPFSLFLYLFKFFLWFGNLFLSLLTFTSNSSIFAVCVCVRVCVALDYFTLFKRKNKTKKTINTRNWHYQMISEIFLHFLIF